MATDPAPGSGDAALEARFQELFDEPERLLARIQQLEARVRELEETR